MDKLQTLKKIYEKLCAEHAQALGQDLNCYDLSKLVLAGEALGLLKSRPELQARFIDGVALAPKNGDELLLQAFDALKICPEQFAFTGCYELIYGEEQQIKTQAKLQAEQLKEMVEKGHQEAIAAAFPLLVWFKQPIPPSVIEKWEDMGGFEGLNLKYHFSLLQTGSINEAELCSALTELELQLASSLSIDELWDACLRWGLLAQLFDPEGMGMQVVTRSLPYRGFRDELCFLTAQGVSTTEPLKINAPASLEGSVFETGPKLTILVPVYNSEKTLEETLASIQRSHYRNWEAVIIDGPSTDNTRAIVQKWGNYDPRFRLVLQKTKGLANARNDGIEASESDLLHCLDGDDVLDPDFYALMIHHLLRLDENPVGRCSVSTVKKFTRRSCVFLDCPPLAAEDMRFDFFAGGGNSAAKSILFERKILKLTGLFDGALTSGEDWDLWARFFRVKVRAVGVKTAIGWYRILDNSLSRDYIPYINEIKRVAIRTAAVDERCPVAVDQEPPVDIKVVHKGLVKIWLENVRRSTCQLDEESTRRLFKWGEDELPDDFWSSPYNYLDNYKFRLVDIGSDELDDTQEFKARMLYLKAFGRWWKGQPIKSLLVSQIEAILYLSKTGSVEKALQNKALVFFYEAPYKNAIGFKLKWHLRKMRE